MLLLLLLLLLLFEVFVVKNMRSKVSSEVSLPAVCTVSGTKGSEISAWCWCAQELSRAAIARSDSLLR